MAPACRARYSLALDNRTVDLKWSSQDETEMKFTQVVPRPFIFTGLKDKLTIIRIIF